MTGRPKRPLDFSQAAKLVADIATGQIEDRAPGIGHVMSAPPVLTASDHTVG